MIRDLSLAVAAELSNRKSPYPVIYGPERQGHDGFTPAIVFRRDRSGHDAIVPRLGATRPRLEATVDNVDAPFNRQVAGVFLVYACSPKPGADVGDHEEECDAVCDMVLTAMHRVLNAKPLPFVITESKLLRRDELADEAEDRRMAAVGSPGHSADPSGLRSADFPGCAARVRFTVRTLVREVTYTGAGGGTGTIFVFAPPVADVSLPGG